MSVPAAVRWSLLAASVLFLFAGLALLPYPGLQNDECLFIQPLYGATMPDFALQAGGREFPIMLMTYLGTTKTLLYRPLLRRWRPSVWSVRLPGLALGALTIWMFGLLLYRLGGTFAAIAGAFLLALDPSYLLTTAFDWGPVALQHFFLVAGVLGLSNFYRSGSRVMLFLGFLAFGLGMWDKALFSWVLTGLVVASLLFLWRSIWQRLSGRNAATAVGAFLLGAAPLVIYNVRSGLETFHGNAKMASASEIWMKTVQMRRTLDGSGLFGYLIREEADGPLRVPTSRIGRFSAQVRDLVGYRRQGWLPLALLLTLACLPFWRAQWKVMAFALVTALIAWLLMASTQEAGGAVHHVVLLWPVPQFLVAFGLSRVASLRWATIVVIALVCLQNGLVDNQYLYNVQRAGASPLWTDAIFPLRDTLVTLHPEHVNLMDWGEEFNMIALTRGTLDLRWAAEPGDRETATENDWKLLAYLLESASTSVWVRHIEPIDSTGAAVSRVTARALDRGYRKETLQIVADRNGRQMFEVYRFVKVNP